MQWLYIRPEITSILSRYRRAPLLYSLYLYVFNSTIDKQMSPEHLKLAVKVPRTFLKSNLDKRPAKNSYHTEVYNNLQKLLRVCNRFHHPTAKAVGFPFSVRKQDYGTSRTWTENRRVHVCVAFTTPWTMSSSLVTTLHPLQFTSI